MLARDFDVFAKPAVEIGGPDMAEWRDARLRKVAASSVNRELNLISAVFNQAMKEWRVGLLVNPVHLVTRPRNPKARTQRVSTADRDTIIARLGWDQKSAPVTTKDWVAFAFSLSLTTAMRKGEVLALTWDNIHLAERYAHLPMTKNGEERDVPLSSAAVALFVLARPKRNGPVIPVQSGNLDKLFREARREVGKMHVRFHDSRREALTVMSTKLANVLELAAVSGHKSLQVLKGYYAPKPGDLAAKLG
jgi:integrase